MIKTLIELGVQFTLTAHDGTTGWKDLLDKTGVTWTDWVYSKKEINKAKAREKDLNSRQS